MLVLTRKESESIVIDGRIRVTVLGINGNRVRLGISAPSDVPVMREELTKPAKEAETSVVANPR